MPSSDNEANTTLTTKTVPDTTPAYKSDNTGDRGNGRGSGQSGDRGSGRGHGRGGRGNNCNGNGGRSDGANASRSNSNQIQSTNPINFGGDNPDVGAALGQRVERFHKKATYTLFIEKTHNCIISNYKDGRDLRLMFKQNIDTTTNFETKHKPPALKSDADNVDIEIKKA